MALLAYKLGFAGIFLDTEMYRGVNLFDYRQQNYRERYSYAEYHQQAYQRGQEVMQALNHGFPGVTILYTYGMTLGSQAGSRNILAQHRYGLLIPFLEGMIASADENTTLVDAFEGSYIYSQELQFLSAYKLIKGQTTYFYTRDASRYIQKVRAGFGLWIDHSCNLQGLQPKGCPNGFTPEAFKRASDHALRYSDKYVWIYSEGINWYTGENIPQEWRDVLGIAP